METFTTFVCWREGLGCAAYIVSLEGGTIPKLFPLLSIAPTRTYHHIFDIMAEIPQDTLDLSALMGFVERDEGESCQDPWASNILGTFADENGQVCDAYDTAIVPRADVSLA